MSVKWFDSEGKIHDKPINKNDVATSENPSLFTAMWIESLKSECLKAYERGMNCWHATTYLVDPENKRLWRRHTKGKFGEHFSLDEMLAVYYFATPEQRKKLPIWWYVNEKPYLRLEILFFVATKYKLIMWLLMPYFAGSMILSLSRTPEHMGGAQKWRVRGAMMPQWFRTFTTWVLKKNGFNWYNVTFDYYATYNVNPDLHPTVKNYKEALYGG